LKHPFLCLRGYAVRPNPRHCPDVLPPAEVATAVRELRADAALQAAYEPLYNKAAARAEQQLRAESRSVGELLGPAAAERLLQLLEGVAGDAAATRAFLRTPAVEGVVGAVLYEAIFQFIQTVDLLGNAVNTLPVIGPIRVQIVAAFKREVCAPPSSSVGRPMRWDPNRPGCSPPYTLVRMRGLG
jgi:hypothetical protein